jgi:hypothetical protein
MRTHENVEPFQQCIVRNGEESLHNPLCIMTILRLFIASLRRDRTSERDARHFLATSASRSIPAQATYVFPRVDKPVVRAFENRV